MSDFDLGVFIRYAAVAFVAGVAVAGIMPSLTAIDSIRRFRRYGSPLRLERAWLAFHALCIGLTLVGVFVMQPFGG